MNAPVWDHAEWEAARRMLDRSVKKRGARARLRDEPATAKDDRRSLRLDQVSVVYARPASKDWRTQAMFSFAAYNLTRLLNLMWLKAV